MITRKGRKSDEGVPVRPYHGEESLGARLENEIAVLKCIPRLCDTKNLNVAI